MPLTPEELDTRFTYHSPKADQAERYVKIRNAQKALAELVVELCPDSREQSLAITKLEEAGYWANASIARRE